MTRPVKGALEDANLKKSGIDEFLKRAFEGLRELCTQHEDSISDKDKLVGEINSDDKEKMESTVKEAS